MKIIPVICYPFLPQRGLAKFSKAAPIDRANVSTAVIDLLREKRDTGGANKWKFSCRKKVLAPARCGISV